MPLKLERTQKVHTLLQFNPIDFYLAYLPVLVARSVRKYCFWLGDHVPSYYGQMIDTF